MRSLTVPLLIAALLALVGCSVPMPTPASPDAQPTPGATIVTSTSSKGTIRSSFPISPGIADVPFLLALDRLREMGYDVQTTQLARFELNIAALANGEADIASSSVQPVWAAIAQGTPIRTVVSRLNNADRIEAKSEIKTCADLANKNIGLSSSTSLNAVLLRKYVEQHCPGTTYTIVAIPQSSNRVTALASGAIDATNIHSTMSCSYEHDNPGKFHSLVTYGDEFPELLAFGFHVHRDFAEQHPEAVRDFVRAYVESIRAIQDKKYLRDAISRHIPEGAVLDSAIDAFVDGKMWDVNGGITNEAVEASLRFFVASDSLPATLTPEDVADTSFLQAVIAELGAK